jgi:thioredoxin-like negative regulator of GroEL
VRSSPISTLPDLEPHHARQPSRPLLVFFTSSTSGRCRRAEAHLAQVLQRRHNHGTFSVKFVDHESRADLFDRFRVERSPTLMVVDEKVIRGKLVDPRGCAEIQTFLAPWLK